MVGLECVVVRRINSSLDMDQPTPIYPPPKSDEAWMTQGVLGERIWLARASQPILDHHVRVTRLLNIVAVVSVFVLGYGLWELDFGLTLVGLVTAMGAKLWFLDRMVWLKSDFDAHKNI